MTTQDFIQKYDGKYVEKYDSTNLNQCVDLIVAYVQEVMQKPELIPMGVGNASQLWTKDTTITPHTVKIANTPDAIPHEGDIVVWSSSYNGGAGHVGIATGWGGLSQFECFEQNDPLKSPAHKKKYSYSSVLGWLRPLDSQDMITITTEERDFLVSRATELKKVGEYLEHPQPDSIQSEAIINTIGGLRSSITTAQRERDEARIKAKNATEENSRLGAQVLILETERDGCIAQSKKLRDMNDEQGRVIGGLEEDIAQRDITIRELSKNVVTGLSPLQLIGLALRKALNG